MSSLIDKIVAATNEDERKKKEEFKKKQDQFYEEVARRQVSTGQGIGAKGNLEYTSQQEGYRIAKAADRIGLHVGDVRKEATKEAELKNQARNELLTEKSKGTITAGQRNPDGSRVTRASGTWPTEPTEAEINAKAVEIIDRDGGVNKHVADKFRNAQQSTQYGITITGQPPKNPDGNPYSPGSIDYYKWQLSNSQKLAEERRTKTQSFEVIRPALVQNYDPFEYVDKSGKTTTKDNAVDVRVKAGFQGELIKTQSEDGKGFDYYYKATPHEQEIYYDQKVVYNLTPDQLTKVRGEAFSNLSREGKSPTQDAVNAEIDRMFSSGKYSAGNGSYFLPETVNPEEQRKQVNTGYAFFKAGQIVDSANKGSASAFNLSEYDNKLIKDNFDEQLKSRSITPAQHAEQMLGLKALNDIPNQVIAYQSEKKRIEDENRKARFEYVQSVRAIKQNAEDLGYVAEVKSKDEHGYITEFNIKAKAGATQYAIFDYDTVDGNGNRVKAGTKVALYQTNEKGETKQIDNFNYKEYAGIDSPILRGLAQMGSSGRELVNDVGGFFGVKEPLKPLDEALYGKNVKVKTPEGAIGHGIGQLFEGKFNEAGQTIATAAQNDPARLVGEFGFEAATTFIGGEAIDAAAKGIIKGVPKAVKFVKDVKTGEAKIVIERPKVNTKFGSDPLGTGIGNEGIGIATKLKSTVSTAKAVVKDGDILSNLKAISPKVKIERVSKTPTKQGVETELSESATASEEVTSDLLNPASNAEKIATDLQWGDKVTPSETTQKILDDMARAGERGKGKKIGKVGQDILKEVSGKVGKGRNNLIASIKSKGKGLKGKAKHDALAERQKQAQTLQDVNKPVKFFKKIGGKAFNPFETKGGSKAAEYQRRIEAARIMDFRATASESRTIMQLEKPIKDKVSKSPLKNVPINPSVFGVSEKGQTSSGKSSSKKVKAPIEKQLYDIGLDVTNVTPPGYGFEETSKSRSTPIYILEPRQGKSTKVPNPYGELVPEITKPTKPTKPDKLDDLFTAVNTTHGGSTHNPFTGPKVTNVPKVSLEEQLGFNFDESLKFDQTPRQRTPNKPRDELIPKETKIRLKAPPIPFLGGGGGGIGFGSGKSGGRSKTKQHTVQDIFGGGAFTIKGEEPLSDLNLKDTGKDVLEIFGIGKKGKKKKGRKRR